MTSSCAAETSVRTSSSIRRWVSSEVSGGARPPLLAKNGDRADLLAHAPAADHLARDLGQLLEIGLGAGASMFPKTISSAARPPSATSIFARSSRSEKLKRSVVRRRERDAERRPARDDRDLAHRVGTGSEHADEGMPALVVGGAAAVLEVIMTWRSAPSTIRSSASVKSDSVDLLVLRRVASSAASLTRLARSAPTMPGVVAAIRPRSTFSASGTPGYAPRGSPCGRSCRAAGPRSGDRSGPGEAAPGRGSRAGWSLQSRSRPWMSRSRPSRSGSGSASARAHRCRR